jgi:hypothetical protein
LPAVTASLLPSGKNTVPHLGHRDTVVQRDENVRLNGFLPSPKIFQNSWRDWAAEKRLGPVTR